MSANAGITWPWLRRIKVTFEGVGADKQSQSISGSSMRTMAFESTGKQDSLRITAMIHKSIQGIPTATNIMLYNLSEDSRGSFQRDTTKVRIEAGWDEGPKAGLKQCFYGTLLSAVSGRAGPDIVTTVNAIATLSDLAMAEERMTWGFGTPVRKVFEDLASLLHPTSIIGLDTIKGAIGFGGWSCGDSVCHALDDLAREFSFSWTSPETGVIQAVGDPVSLGLKATIADPYLIDLNPILSGPLQITTGLSVRCTFEADITPGYDIQVQSKISPKFNGTSYRVCRVTHNLDCFNKHSFISNAVAFMPPSAKSL